MLAITEDLQQCKDLQHEALSVQDPLDTLQATLQNTNSGNQSNDSALRSERSKQGNHLQPAELRKQASLAELRRANGFRINDNMPKVSAKHGGTKSDLDHSNDPFAKQMRTEKEVTNLSSTYFSDKFRTEADAACSIETKSDPKRCNIGSSKAELVNKDVKSEPTGDSLLQHFGFELDATRVVQRDGPSDGRRRGGCGGGPGTANRGGRGRSNHGAQGAVSKNRTSLDPSVNIGCAELLSYTAYGEYPRVKAFQNSAAFVSAAFGGSGIQFNGTRFAPVNESYQ